MKKSATRIIALLMTVICISTLFACKKEEGDSKEPSKKPTQSKESRDIRLPFCQEDSLNPYVAQSQINHNIMPLIFSSLYKNDGSFEPQPEIAQSGTVLGIEVTVRLNSDKRFADGSYIGADDVAYSFGLAKQSPYYSQSLINIIKAQAKGTQEVVFTLAVADAFALSCLDYPVVKSGTKVDGTDQTPVASGRYHVNMEGSQKYLELNTHYRGYSPVRSKIELVNITDSNAIIHSLVIGNIDSLFCNLSDGKYERINASSQEVVMNNFVFLGINSYSTKIADPALRQAISAALDREKIKNEGFQGYAIEAYTPFNPKWFALGSNKQPGKEVDISKAKEYISKNTKRLNLKLVVNADNGFKKTAGQIIAQELKAAGINVTVAELPFAAYNSAIASGSYDLYLGEMRLTDNMNIYPLLPTASTSYGFYTQLLDGTITMQNFLDNFYAEMPFIPICYRKGVLAFSREIAVEVKSNENDIYANVGEWFLK